MKTASRPPVRVLVVDDSELVRRGIKPDVVTDQTSAHDELNGYVPNRMSLEEARALGELRKQGWQPKRTIVYAAWDGEEPALLGSTEWAEAQVDRGAAFYFTLEGEAHHDRAAG